MGRQLLPESCDLEYTLVAQCTLVGLLGVESVSVIKHASLIRHRMGSDKFDIEDESGLLNMDRLNNGSSGDRHRGTSMSKLLRFGSTDGGL